MHSAHRATLAWVEDGGTIFHARGSVSQASQSVSQKWQSSIFLKMVPHEPLCGVSSHLSEVAASPQALRVADAVTFYHALTAPAQHQYSIEKGESCYLHCDMISAYNISHEALSIGFRCILASIILEVALTRCERAVCFLYQSSC